MRFWFNFRFQVKPDTGVVDDQERDELLGCALGLDLGFR